MENASEVAGFEFYLAGMTITDISGGTADQYMDFVSYNPESGKIVGTSFSGGTIPAGSSILTQIAFADYNDGEVCAENAVFADVAADALYTDTGDCACPVGLDECGQCGGPGIADGACDCFGNVEDDCGVCAGDNSSCVDCADVPNGDNELDNCGTCDNDSNNDCDMDCAGTWGGSLEIDDCGECGGSGLGLSLIHI